MKGPISIKTNVTCIVLHIKSWNLHMILSFVIYLENVKNTISTKNKFKREYNKCDKCGAEENLLDFFQHFSHA